MLKDTKCRTQKIKQLTVCFLFLSAGAFLLFFGMPNFGRIQQNRLNSRLLRAVHAQDVLAAAALLKQGANVNTKDDNPITSALFRMFNDGDVEGGYTVLMSACVDGNVPLVQLLLGQGADMNMKDDTGTTALMWSVMAQNSQIVALLLAKGAPVNAADAQGSTALMQAAMRGDLVVIKQLLKHGADVKARDKQSHTALAWAIHKRLQQVTALLKQAGATE